MAQPKFVSETEAWKALEAHVAEIEETHLRDLLLDDDRTEVRTQQRRGWLLSLGPWQRFCSRIPRFALPSISRPP